MQRRLYFAYGSNLNWKQMKQRCPSARFLCIAFLPDYKLAFTRRSIQRGCGVADVVHESGYGIWGVVYEMSEIDVGKLDACEGYRPGRQKNSYYRRECEVLQDGHPQQPKTVFTYFGRSQRCPPLPNAAYKELIVSGARYWKLPESYVRELEAISVAN